MTDTNDMRAKFDKSKFANRHPTFLYVWEEAYQAGAASVQGQEPVAEVIECPTMGQQTVREIDGRWKFLKYGDLLYAAPVQQGLSLRSGEQCHSDTETLRKAITKSVVSVSHSIDSGKVILYRDKTQEGNALSQLIDRIATAVQPKEPT